MQFSTSLEMLQNDKGKVVLVSNTVSKEKLAIKVVKLQETVKNLTEKIHTNKLMKLQESFVMKSNHQNRTCPGLHLRLNYVLKISLFQVCCTIS